jgi:hypothetical protein
MKLENATRHGISSLLAVCAIGAASMIAAAPAQAAANCGIAITDDGSSGTCWSLPAGMSQWRMSLGCERVGGTQFYINYSLWRSAGQNGEVWCRAGYEAVQTHLQFR